MKHTQLGCRSDVTRSDGTPVIDTARQEARS